MCQRVLLYGFNNYINVRAHVIKIFLKYQNFYRKNSLKNSL
nr:MAG TPA: hypothetical protein [Caudoviricetes sp.]